MKLWKKILIVVSIILCVGLLGASIARTAVKPVTVGRSGFGNSASTPAATEPAASEPEEQVFRIPVLIQENLARYFTVLEDGVEVDPFDTVERSMPSSYEESKGGAIDDDEDEPYEATYLVYLLDPSVSSISWDHSSRPATPWFCYYCIDSDYNHVSTFCPEDNEINTIRGSFDLDGWLCLVIYF